jgi:hypothetical protein
MPVLWARLARMLGEAARAAERSRRETERAWRAFEHAVERPPGDRHVSPAGPKRSSGDRRPSMIWR